MYWQCVANAKLMTLSFPAIVPRTPLGTVRPSVRLSAHPLALLASEKFRRGKLCQTRHKMTGKCLLNDASETQKGTPAGFVPSLPRFASPVPHATPSMPRICQCGLHCQRRRLVLLLLRLRLRLRVCRRRRRRD